MSQYISASVRMRLSNMLNAILMILEGFVTLVTLGATLRNSLAMKYVIHRLKTFPYVDQTSLDSEFLLASLWFLVTLLVMSVIFSWSWFLNVVLLFLIWFVIDYLHYNKKKGR